MNDFLARTADLAQSWLDRQPDLALMLGVAAVVFSVAWVRRHAAIAAPDRFWQSLVLHGGAVISAAGLTAGLIVLHAGLRGSIQEVDRYFSRHHGRITEANRGAVETIWGSSQIQRDLMVQISYDEETEQRIQSAELDKPDIIHKVKTTTTLTDNPFRKERHIVTLRANPRQKGSGVYAGYETQCQFLWTLANPADRETDLTLRLPLPADDAVFFDLAATWNNVDVLQRTTFANGCLVFKSKLAPHQEFTFEVAFRSRGLETWYFQNQQERELRGFELTLNLPDIARADLNYPEGCMTPTDIAAVGAGSRLVYRLDHALSSKGMGVAMPTLTQPGQAIGGVLSEAARGWTLFFALLWIGLTLADIPGAWLWTALCAAPVAYSYGLLADLTDAGLPWYLALAATVLPFLLLAAAAIVWRLKSVSGWILGAGLLLFGLGYPLGAGLDDARFMMYRNIAALLFIGIVAWLTVRRRPVLPARPGDAVVA